MPGGETNTTTLIEVDEGVIEVGSLGDNLRRVRLIPAHPDVYVHRDHFDTDYPDELLLTILRAKGFGFVCDEIARDQDPDYLERHLLATIRAHVDPASLAGARVLDFGCGAGASTSILGRALPRDTEIVGVELEDSFLDVARARARFYGLDATRFELSPAGDRLPDSIGRFDAVVLSAVFEHLLPNERSSLMPVLWEAVKPGGMLFIDETPWRWFPIETHTTGIPLLNYVPDAVALRLAKRSPKMRERHTWTAMLRAGIRGGTTKSILRSLDAQVAEAQILQPDRDGMSNWTDLWFNGYARGGVGRHAAAKRSAYGALRLVERTTRVPAVPYLSLAIKKH